MPGFTHLIPREERRRSSAESAMLGMDVPLLGMLEASAGK